MGNGTRMPWSYRKRAISRPKNTTWPLRIRFRASRNENQSARSTSGNSCWRPDFGGHSIEKVLLAPEAGYRFGAAGRPEFGPGRCGSARRITGHLRTLAIIGVFSYTNLVYTTYV